jgi:uncharacterized membrane protein required for colicin V production
MNYLDAILGILLILSAIGGFAKGFVEELAGLVALILGIWAAIHFSDLVGVFLTETFNLTFKHLNIVSFIVTFIFIAFVPFVLFPIALILLYLASALLPKAVTFFEVGFTKCWDLECCE